MKIYMDVQNIWIQEYMDIQKLIGKYMNTKINMDVHYFY